MNYDGEISSVWESVLAVIGEDFSKTVTNMWFADLTLTYLDDKYAVLLGKYSFKCGIVRAKYLDTIAEKLAFVLGFRVTVYIFSKEDGGVPENFRDTDPKNPPEKEKSPDDEPSFYTLKGGDESIEKFGKDEDNAHDRPKEKLLNPYNRAYTFENFIVGISNKFACAACEAVADNPATAYNPLFIYGHSGLGKTHLLYAITNRISERLPTVKIVYVKCEEFLNQLISAISRKETAEFREKYRRADVLLIDDIQAISGREALQEEFFNTFNALYDSEKQIILTSDRPPKDIKTLEDRLRSRFEWGLIVDVQPPDYELRLAILKSKSENLGINIPSEVLDFLAEKLQDNVRQIEGVIKKLGAQSFLSGTPITMASAKDAVSDIVTGTVPVNVTIDKIFSAVSKKYGISVDEIKGRRRTKDIARARHISVYLIKRLTDIPLTNIAKIFDRDHTTVMSSLDFVDRELAENPTAESEINELINELK